MKKNKSHRVANLADEDIQQKVRRKSQPETHATGGFRGLKGK